MRRGLHLGPHLDQRDIHAALGQRPGSFAPGQAPANHPGTQVFHTVKISLRP